MIKRIPAKIMILILLVGFLSPVSASAQESEEPLGPVYIVQEGDTLWDIAVLFNVTLTDLVNYNNLLGQDIYIGDRIVIPGLEELSGILSIQPVPLGETLRSLSRQYGVSQEVMLKLNRMINPAEVYAGYGLIVLQQEEASPYEGYASLTTGDTLLELSVRNSSSPWILSTINQQPGTIGILPGDLLVTPGTKQVGHVYGLPGSINQLTMDPLPVAQGQTVQIYLHLIQDATPSGELAGRQLQFFSLGQGEWVALQGIHAMSEPGLYPFRLDILLSTGFLDSFEQMVYIQDGFFRQDPILQVEPSTIDPSVTEPENEFLIELVAPITPEKFWDGPFIIPVDNQYCIRSMYGNRRSYNGSDYIYFHTGVDYGVCSENHPFEIYSPASGVVIFSGPLTVRGIATVIDHGWGIYSGLWHQEESYVTVGEMVEAGQMIGKIGETGRVTGPHLHWEVWVNGIQVDPLQWLDEVFPHPDS